MRPGMIALLVAGLATATAASAQTIQVATPGSVQAALRQLGARFTAETGITVEFTSGSGGSTLKRLQSDAPIDVIALADHELTAMAKAGLLRPDSVVPFGSVRVGLAVRAGAPVPDISTRERLREVLRAARAVSYSNPAGGSTSGAQVVRVLEQLGIAAEVVAKTQFVGAKGLASGAVDVHLQPTSEMMQVAGITVVGPLPADLNAGTALGLAVVTRTTAPQAAEAFLRYAVRAESAPVLSANGVTPAAAPRGMMARGAAAGVR